MIMRSTFIFLFSAPEPRDGAKNRIKLRFDNVLHCFKWVFLNFSSPFCYALLLLLSNELVTDFYSRFLSLMIALNIEHHWTTTIPLISNVHLLLTFLVSSQQFLHFVPVYLLSPSEYASQSNKCSRNETSFCSFAVFRSCFFKTNK